MGRRARKQSSGQDIATALTPTHCSCGDLHEIKPRSVSTPEGSTSCTQWAQNEREDRKVARGVLQEGV